MSENKGNRVDADGNPLSMDKLYTFIRDYTLDANDKLRYLPSGFELYSFKKADEKIIPEGTKCKLMSISGWDGTYGCRITLANGEQRNFSSYTSNILKEQGSVNSINGGKRNKKTKKAHKHKRSSKEKRSKYTRKH